MLDHFSCSELVCSTTGEVHLASGFGAALEHFRITLDAPIYLTIACRSPADNAKVSGYPPSLYLTINEYQTTCATCAVGEICKT